VVKATLPGIKPEDLELTVERGHLTIKGEVKVEEEAGEHTYLLRERTGGVYGRMIALPTPVDDAKIDL
jgi:HSP20 family protein